MSTQTTRGIHANTAIIWPGDDRYFETSVETEDYEYYYGCLQEVCTNSQGYEYYELRLMSQGRPSSEAAMRYIDEKLQAMANHVIASQRKEQEQGQGQKQSQRK